MDKKSTFSVDNRLKSYSALAGTFVLAAASADAQVVYTDVNPDQTFGTPGDIYSLDLNNDFTTDFAIMVGSASGTYYGGAINYVIDAVGIVTTSSNEVVGSYGSNANYANALNMCDPIDDNQNFISAPVSTSANVYGAAMGGVVQVTGIYSTTFGLGEFLGTTDKFLGLKLITGGNTHYGWARVDVGLDGKSFTIKDYAYEMTPQTVIEAGDVGQGCTPSAIADISLDRVQTYFYNGSLIVNVGDQVASTGTVTIVNTSGQDVAELTAQPGQNRYEIDGLASGVYMVRTVFAEGEAIKKIMVR